MSNLNLFMQVIKLNFSTLIKIQMLAAALKILHTNVHQHLKLTKIIFQSLI